MSKYDQSNERNSRDYYPTPAKAVLSLKKHMFSDTYEYHKGDKRVTFIEPCAGDGRLIQHLAPEFECTYASDLDPQVLYKSSIVELSNEDTHTYTIHNHDVFTHDWSHKDYDNAEYFITNPPWINDGKTNNQLNRLIETLSIHKPTWFLLNGSYAFNKKSASCMEICTDIIPVGRLKWIENSPHMGKEDCAWFCFDQTKSIGAGFFGTRFHPRKV